MNEIISQIAKGCYIHSIKHSDYWANKEFVLNAIEHDSEFYKFASLELQNDKDVVLKVVETNGHYIQSIPNDLKYDRDVIRASLKTSIKGIDFISKEMKKDIKFYVELMKINPYVYISSSIIIKNNREIALELSSSIGGYFSYFPTKFRDDKEIVLNNVRNHGLSLKHVSERLRKDEYVITTAVNNNKNAIDYAL